ncbi:MAG: hypothetical protein E7591_04495 [Ruminococcaceae bacterium]|nr:hypothetical protein [Oscillospiraceae bacterium]
MKNLEYEDYIKNKLNEPNTYSQGYVAFLDMMGFQKLCKDESCERIKAIIDDIELFKYKFINSFSKLVIPEDIISQTTVKIISDSIIVTAPDNYYGLLYILYFTATLHMILLDCDVLLRGGIEKGDFFVTETTIFGPAVIDSYDIENSTTYPRVQISASIIDDLRKIGFEKKKTVDYYTDLKNDKDLHLSEIETFICKDFDDCYFVHYFNTIENIALFRNSVKKERIYHFIEEQIKKYKGNKKLSLKYGWLRNYYDHYLSKSFISKISEELHNGRH